MRPQIRAALLLASLALVACAPIAAGRTPDAPLPDSSLSTLSADDLTGAEYTDLYQAIQTLRGGWLAKRGPTSITSERDIVVYLDNNQLGGPSALKTISTYIVSSARRLSAVEAQAIFGLNHPYGAIVVSSRTP